MVWAMGGKWHFHVYTTMETLQWPKEFTSNDIIMVTSFRIVKLPMTK